MPLLNFTPQFVGPIRARTKQQTIRASRKNPIEAGDRLFLYCGLRQPGAYRILPEPVTCTRVEPISIGAAGHLIPGIVILGGNPLSDDEREALAVADGFSGWPEMRDFFQDRLPFAGQIVYWAQGDSE